tara:strand:+ start:1027 stop:1701 length:675 start_codon:yes stop_codon:yes gene_type:complete
MSNIYLYDPGEFLAGGYFTRIIKAAKTTDGRFIIAGYASPILKDKKGRTRGDREGDSLSLDALDKGYRIMMKYPSRRNLMGYHSNTQIGELLEGPIIDDSGTIWNDGVIREISPQYPKKGLFVIAEVFPDRQESRRYKMQMEMGNMLAFSIGGETISQKTICEGSFCRNEIDEIDLNEVSSCQIGMNPEAKAFILKAIKPNTLDALVHVKSGAGLLKALYANTL